MISRIPVYQMTFGKGKDGNVGLLFTSEQVDYSNQSVIFTIPILQESNYLIDFINKLREIKIFFPFELDGKYFELNAEIYFPEFIFTVPTYKQRISFIVDYESFKNWPLLPYLPSSTKGNKYVGRYKKLLPRNRGFLSLLPIDLYEMDQLYLENKGIFVGLTPNFGNSEIEF